MYGRYFVLFAILFTGWFLRKINFIDDKMNHSINKLIVYFAYPCLIVHNIGGMDSDPGMLAAFATTFVISLILFYIYGAVCFFYAKLRHFPPDSSNILEFAMAMPNDGFMGFPVALIFFGDMGLLLMLAHNAAMNFFTFTYGLKLIRRNYEENRKATPMSVLKAALRLLVNPNILALIAGFVLSLTVDAIPEAVDEYLMYLGGISTPMAMIFIGSSLAGHDLLDIIKSRVMIESGAVKLILLPALTAAVMYLLPVQGIIKAVVVLGACFPVAAITAMLSEQEGQDPTPASQSLFLSTLLSIVTVPLSVNIIEMLFM